MSDINKVILSGRTTADISLNKTSSGKNFCAFALAVDSPRKNNPTDFIRVEAWETVAENLVKYVGKGSKISIEGHITVKSYPDDEKHKKRVVIVVDKALWGNVKEPSVKPDFSPEEEAEKTTEPEISVDGQPTSADLSAVDPDNILLEGFPECDDIRVNLDDLPF